MATRLPAADDAPLLATLAPRRVLLFRALQLGDMLCAVPAMRALRRALPEAHITLVGLPWAADLAQRLPQLVYEFVAFPGHPALPEREPDAAAWPTFLDAVRRRRVDLAIQMHGDGSRTNALVAQFGARVCAGFAPQTEGRRFLAYPTQGAEPRRLMQLAAFLGAPVNDERLEFPLCAEDDPPWAARPAVRALPPGGYFCIHPGARALERRWPVAHFARVADAVVEATGLQAVVTGSEHEADLASGIAAAMRHPVVDAAAAVPVGALAAVIARSRLLVGNDTGTSHLAAALQVPSVIVFRASEIDRWAPLDRERHRPVRDPAGTEVDAVISEALRLLRWRAAA